MGTVINLKTKTNLGKIFKDGLSAVLNAEHKLPNMNTKMIATLLVDQLIADPRFIDCMSTIVPENSKELLTTEDAARLSGFSRPFIIALLDGPLYPGQVTRTPKGHRRVERSEFMAWLGTVSKTKDLPKTVKTARSGPRDEDFLSTPMASADNPARQAKRDEQMQYARSRDLF